MDRGADALPREFGVWQVKPADAGYKTTYDAVGNLLTQTDARGTKLWFGYDVLNRLTQKRLTNALGTPLANYTYDDTSNGNKGKGRRTGMRAYVGGNVNNSASWTYDKRGGVTSSYVYDGDGKRVKETIAGVTRVFVGNYYELDNGTVKKYYYAGATRVAERSGGVLYYLLSDHLGSTALTLDSSGNRLNTNTELRYYPYGGARYNTGGQLTTYRFTGQRWDSGTALYFYQSRWYDPAVGRFLAGDTIVPQPQNPQNLNRYSYCGSNPLKYVDSSGHNAIEFWGGAGGGGGVAFLMAVTGLAQSVSQQTQSLTVTYGPELQTLVQTWYVHGNSIIAAADQLSQATQNASQAGNTADPGRFDPNDPRFREVVDRAKEAKVTIEPGKLDFLLGKVSTPGTIEKSAQRGIDFGQKLGYTEGGLSKALMEQARNFDAVSQVRISKLGNPLVNFESIVTGPSGLQAKLISSWELKDGVLRLVTSWAEILK